MADESTEALLARVAELEARLHAATREVADVYHDVSNPVSVLGGNIDLLGLIIDDFPVDDTVRETVRDLGLAMEKLNALLERLRHLRNALRTGEPIGE